MAVVEQLIRAESDGSISFGNYQLPEKKKLENLFSYHILCEQGFKNELDAFLEKYELCQSSSEYAEDWDRLNEILANEKKQQNHGSGL